MKRILLTSILSLSILIVSAQLFVENFSYTDGDLTANAAWSAHSGGGANAVQVTSNNAILTHGSGSREDVNASFSSQSSGSVYYSLELSVNDNSAISGTDSEYFVHFNTSTFVARVDIVPPSAAGDYSVGIATENSTAEATWASDLSFNTTYTVVVEYDIDNNSTTLWVDPVNEMSTSINGADLSGTGDAVSRIALRQTNSSSDETISISEIIVDVVFPAPLPVSLTSFSAKSMDTKSVVLDWSTTAEENNDYFVIEHSIDGRDFINIGMVQGALNSNESQFYNFIHKDATKGINYYRLRQVDLDGNFTFSSIEAVSLSSDIVLEVRPTLAKSSVQFSINEELNNETHLEVFNILGRLVMSQTLASGDTQINFDISNLQSGHYFVKMTNGFKSKTSRFIKQ